MIFFLEGHFTGGALLSGVLHGCFLYQDGNFTGIRSRDFDKSMKKLVY